MDILQCLIIFFLFSGWPVPEQEGERGCCPVRGAPRRQDGQAAQGVCQEHPAAQGLICLKLSRHTSMSASRNCLAQAMKDSLSTHTSIAEMIKERTDRKMFLDTLHVRILLDARILIFVINKLVHLGTRGSAELSRCGQTTGLCRRRHLPGEKYLLNFIITCFA